MFLHNWENRPLLTVRKNVVHYGKFCFTSPSRRGLVGILRHPALGCVSPCGKRVTGETAQMEWCAAVRGVCAVHWCGLVALFFLFLLHHLTRLQYRVNLARFSQTQQWSACWPRNRIAADEMSVRVRGAVRKMMMMLARH